MYKLPHYHHDEHAIIADEEAIKDNIDVAVKHYLLKERERILGDLVEDALTDIRQELHSRHHSDDEIPQRDAVSERSTRKANRQREVEPSHHQQMSRSARK